MFQGLPPEVIANVFSLLSIKDCRALTSAFNPSVCLYKLAWVESESVRNPIGNYILLKDILNDKLSITIYLAKHFPNANGLLKSMFDNDVLISGSRALNFFTPFSLDENSDWDFYILDNSGKKEKFMKDMTYNGIKWHSKEVESSNLVNYPSILCISTLSGVLSYRGINTKVELITCKRDNTILENIRNFHASIVQCFISPLMAVHMYANDAYSGRSTVWNTDYSQTPYGEKEVAKWISKYKARNIQFYNKSMHFINYPESGSRAIKRIIGDPSTDVIKYDKNILDLVGNSAYRKVNLKQQELNGYTWLEYASELSEDKQSNYYNSVRLSLFAKHICNRLDIHSLDFLNDLIAEEDLLHVMLEINKENASDLI